MTFTCTQSHTLYLTHSYIPVHTGICICVHAFTYAKYMITLLFYCIFHIHIYSCLYSSHQICILTYITCKVTLFYHINKYINIYLTWNSKLWHSIKISIIAITHCVKCINVYNIYVTKHIMNIYNKGEFMYKLFFGR